MPFAKTAQCSPAEKIGIALAGLRKLDDALGDHLIGHVVSIRTPKSYAPHHLVFVGLQTKGGRQGAPQSGLVT
jgi:hypothetical protein